MADIEEYEKDEPETIEDGNQSLIQKLWLLFPESFRNVSYVVFTQTCNAFKAFYNFGRTATWLFFSTSILIFIPVILEVERAEIENEQRRHQSQLLFGSNSPVTQFVSSMQRFED
ncbi:mitochondrial import receptor subunit TOM22 homolog isoform X1 [Schistocerca gregaria]|uniref:mitochondrial import receptor subunit TOM22 homolog isoform X1 n=1 Tax=Schistocerca gregaria TaxID=7010 RepID=UPI00211EC7D4|nr:mitochondrial import receptor subunit TOM22 homolog isoform X1 [Schistocerca gregaria]